MRESAELSRHSPIIETCERCADYSSSTPIDVKHTIFNAATFQGAWLDLIVFNSGAALFFIGILGVQLWRLFKAHFRDLLLPVASVFCLGLLLDSVFSYYQFFQFDGSGQNTSPLPLWLVMIWFAFALSLPVSFSWLLHKPSLAVAVFACMAPLSYIAGRHLGVIDFSNGTILLISLAWALVAFLSCRWLGFVARDRDGL